MYEGIEYVKTKSSRELMPWEANEHGYDCVATLTADDADVLCQALHYLVFAVKAAHGGIVDGRIAAYAAFLLTEQDTDL